MEKASNQPENVTQINGRFKQINKHHIENYSRKSKDNVLISQVGEAVLSVEVVGLITAPVEPLHAGVPVLPHPVSGHVVVVVTEISVKKQTIKGCAVGHLSTVGSVNHTESQPYPLSTMPSVKRWSSNPNKFQQTNCQPYHLSTIPFDNLFHTMC